MTKKLERGVALFIAILALIAFIAYCAGPSSKAEGELDQLVYLPIVLNGPIKPPVPTPVSPPTMVPTATPTNTAVPVATATPTSTNTATPTPTPTNTATATPTPTPTCVLVAPSTISVNTTWQSGCTYIAENGVLVNKDVTLTIEENVVVEVGAYRHFRVYGTLHVKGTATNPVTMRGVDRANWIGLEIDTPSASHNDLVHLNVENSLGGLNHIYGTIWATNVTIDDWGAYPLPPVPTACEFEVAGTIVVDTVWQSGCTYIVEPGMTVTVDRDATLTIPEGVTVLMGDWVIFNVNGTLAVYGTAEAPVVFRRRYEELSWAGLLFSGHDARGDLNYLVVDGAYCPLHVWPGFLRVSFQATHTVFNGWRSFGEGR